MLHIIALLIYAGTAVLMYRIVLKGRKPPPISKKALLRAFLGGALPCTACIAVCELLFDRFVYTSTGSLGGEILTSFLRAALIEEAFKLIFSLTAVKKSKPESETGFMLLSGMVGAGYGLIEKLAFGGGVILIANAFLPLHIFFQFLMGAQLYRARNSESSERKKFGFLAYFLPFLVHGAWDSLLAAAGFLLEREAGGLQTAGFLLFLALISGGILTEIKVIKKMKRSADSPIEGNVGIQTEETE